MYSQFQRFVATVLLFSIMLQSCGNPHCKMAEPAYPSTSGKTSSPRHYAPLALVNKHKNDSEHDTELVVPKTDQSSEVSAAVASEAPYVSSAAPSRAAHDRDRSSTPTPTAASSLVVPTSNVVQASRPSSGSKKPPQQNANKPCRVVLNKASMSQNTLQQTEQARATPPSTLAAPGHRKTQLSRPLQRIVHPALTKAKPSPNDTVHQRLSCATLPGSATQGYPSAQGHLVRFQEEEGKWQAMVHDGWGRVQKLPVICAPDQMLASTIQQLASKALGQYKYWVHILDTDQSPWAPRVVYVGALGLRGGGQVGSLMKRTARAYWGVLTSPIAAIVYACKKKIPPLPCRVTALPKFDKDDLHDSEVDNGCKVEGEWVTFTNEKGYWYARTSKGLLPVKSQHSASLSLEDLVGSQFSIRKYREKSFLGGVEFVIDSYDKYTGLGYELELVTSPEQIQTSKQARRHQRREQKQQEEERKKQEEECRKQEEKQKKQEAALRREEERRVREEAQKQQELGEKKQVDGEALVESVSKAASANFYTDFDQADSLAGAYATQRHSMIRELAKELRQGQLGSLEHEVIADGYLSDEELDCDLTNNMGSGLNFGDTTDHLTSVGPQKEVSEETKQREVPPTPEGLANLLRDKRKHTQSFSRQEQALQSAFHELLLDARAYLTGWQNTAVESYTDPDLQVPLQNLHENILALFPALSNWETSLKNLEKALEDWESNLHEPDGDSWLVERNLKDHEKLVEHFEKAQQTFADTQSQYKTFLQQICTHVYTPHYHTALTTPLLQQQALSLAQTLIQESNHAVAATEQTLKQADQACQKAQTRDTKARGQLENVCKKLIRKRVEVMAHTLDHQPLLDYLAGKSRKYINEKDDQGKTALHYAITQNQLELVQWLLDHGADKEARDKDGLTPLHWASREGHTPTVALLLAANADVAAKHKNAYTPLHFAADRGHTDVVKILLNAEKVDIEAKDEEGLTPLYQSVINNHTAVSKLLLARNADIAAKDQWGSTPLHRAVLEGHLATVALLLEYRAAIESQDAEKYTPLHLAVQQNHIDTVNLLLVRGADRKAKDNDGFTPLHYAVLPGYIDILEVLLDHAPNIENQDIDGFTLLHLAAQQGHKAIVELLLKKGAAIEAKDAAGCTPLHCAAQQGYTATVELLLTKGANKEAIDHLGFTPLHWAVQQRHPIIVELLLIRGADPTIKDIRGKTPRTLVIAQRNQLGDPARHVVLQEVKAMAQLKRHWPLLYYLAGKGAQYINERDSQGNTALHCATNLNKPDIVQWLLDHGADIEAIDTDNCTPLHLAVMEGYVAIVKILLEHGANIEAREKIDWATPLHMAGLLGHQAAVQLLLDHGANATAQSQSGKMPSCFAAVRGHNEVASLLRAAQASTALGLALTAGQTQAAEQSSIRVATPTLAAAAFPLLPLNVKDAPALAQVKAELQSILDIHQAAQQTAEAAAKALEEARAATIQAKNQSQASLAHLQTMQQHMARLTDIPPAPRCIALYLQDSVKDAQDYLCTLPETDEAVLETQKQQGNKLLAILYDRLQREQQYYRHADQLFLCDATLTEYVQAQLLGEVLPQHQYHIDTLNHLIRKFVETGHTVTSPHSVLPPHKTTDDKSVKSTPVRSHAAKQHQDEQSTSAQSAPGRGYTKKSKRNASDSSNGSLVFVENFPAQRKEQEKVQDESYSLSECSSESLGLSSDGEDGSTNSFTSAEAQSTDEESTTEESRSQAGAKRKAAAFKKRKEEFIKRETARKKREEEFRIREADSEFGPCIVIQKTHSTKTTEAKSVKSAPVRGYAARQYQDEQSTGAKSAPTGDHATRQNRADDDDTQGEVDSSAQCIELHVKIKSRISKILQDNTNAAALMSTSLGLSSDSDSSSSESLGLSSDGEDDSTNSFTSAEAQSTDEESTTEESRSQAEAKRKAAAFKKRKEEFIKRETARKQREERFRSRLRDSEFGPPTHKTHSTKTTEAKSVKSAPVRGYAARQCQDEQSTGAKSAPTGDHATRQNRADDRAQGVNRIIAQYMKSRMQQAKLRLKQDTIRVVLPASRILLPHSEENINSSFASSVGEWSSIEEDTTEESRSQAEAKRKAAAFKKRKEEFIKRETARKKREEEFRIREADSEFGPCIVIQKTHSTKATDDRSVKSAPVRGYAARQHQDEQSTGAQSVPTGDYAKRQNRVDGHAQGENGILARYIELRVQAKSQITGVLQDNTNAALLSTSLGLSSDSDSSLSESLGLSSDSEEDSDNSFASTELQSKNEEGTTEESISQAEAGRKAEAIKKRQEEFRRREAAAEANARHELGPRTNSSHDVLSEQDAVLLSRIMQLGVGLPASQKGTFQGNIAPILQEKLLPVPVALREKVFHYFLEKETIYPQVLYQYPVQDWVAMSLLYDLAQGTPPSDASHTRFHALSRKLRGQYSAEILEAILWILRDKKAAHSLSLDELCDVTEMLPKEGVHAQALLRLPENQWLLALKRAYLQLSIDTYFPYFDAGQYLVEELSHLNCSLQVTQTLLRRLPQVYSPKELSHLLAFMAQYPIDEDQIMEILNASTSTTDSLIAYWHHQLACSLLKEKLSKLLPQEMRESTYAMIEKIWAHAPTYQAITTFLEKLYLRKLQEDGFVLDTEHLHPVLSMMQDYRLDEAIYSRLLQQLVGLPSHQWGQYLYTQILQHCFSEEAHERTTSEIIEYMAQHSPEVAYVQDQAKLTQAHQNILDAYQKESTILSGRHSIASWDAATVTKWAQTVKDYAKDPAKGTLPPQCELIAVVKRAVELHHGYTPRNTQLLSLLVLLNPTLDKGRLLQINTGEGKSLTVAMFAAIQTLLNKKSDIVTTSTELSIPEVGNQRPFFEMLALSVAENSGQGAGDANANKQQAYQQDNVYGTPADFQSDILRTEFFGKEMRARRSFEDTVVVVDEVDNMLFDGRSHSIRISSNMPGTNHLTLLLAVVWQQVRYWASHLISDRGKVYLIEEDFYKDPDGHITILSGEEKDPQQCMLLVERDAEDLIKELAQDRLDQFLRDLNEDEQAAYAASKKLERAITILRMDMDSTSDSDKHKKQADQLAQLEKEHQALPWNADKEKYPHIVSVPAHLKGLAKQQAPKWIQSAISALIYKKGCHYDVQDGKIVPVDYNNTGVWQHNMVWSNGLAQFLQIKEGLKVSPESISTNFISTVGFFQRYANRLYGLTGTLGNEVTQEFFSKVYDTDLVIVPPYKQRLIVGNASSPYACKELTPRLIADKNTDKWYEAIEASALQHAQQKRAVLIICKYIRQVHDLKERLQRHYAHDKIFTYTGKGKFAKNKVYPGEIIIATNIAGRGTDLTPSELIEHHGGLHVCITFLPENYRVELQNAGRTARKGSKGTTQLILHQPEATTIEELRQQRDEKEAKGRRGAIDEVECTTFKDKLFQRFCQVENKLLPTLGSFERMRHSRRLERTWADHAKQALAPEAVQDFYNKRIDDLAQNALNAIPSNQWSSLSSAEKQAKKDDVVRQMRVALPFEKFQKDYVTQKRREMMQELQAEMGIGVLHPDVVTAFQEGRRYVPENGALADKYGWGPHERKAVEERFGLWFHAHVHQSEEPIDYDAVNIAFDAFLKEIQEDAKANKLIHNPYFYVQKGNDLLQSDELSAAVSAYDKAIAGDPDFSLHARHNKAMALLAPKKNKSSHTKVLQELREAKILIEQYKERLVTFQAVIGSVEAPKPYTAQHLQHHLDILFQQEKHIDVAVSVIDSARSHNNHVKITEKISVGSLFNENAAQEHREKALEEVRENGLSYFFTVAEKKPKPWLSICTVALIGLVQITAAVFATLSTGGMMAKQLLSLGISDLITAITSAISGEFSWKEWGISKAISIGVSIISFGIAEGWSKIKEGIKGLGESIKTGFKEVRKMASKKGAKAVKDALIKQVNEVTWAISKGVGKACGNMLVRHGVQESLGEILEKKITEAVSQSIMQSMLKNEFIQKAMAHDTAQGRDYWAQIFIREGLSMLNEKDSAWQTILKGIIEGTALQQLTEHIEKLYGKNTSKTAILTSLASTGLPMLSGFLTDINGFTDTFLAKFHKRLAQKYGQELANMATTTQENESEDTEATHVANADQEFMYVMDAQEHPDDEELQLHDRHNGQAFSTQAKVAPQQVVTEAKTSQEDRTKTLGQVLTNNVSAQLLGKVHQHIINPLISLAAGSFLEHITSGVTARLQQQRESALNVHRVNREGNERANLPAEVGQSVQDVTEAEVKALQEADKDSEGDITRLPEYAKILGIAIEYKKSGCNKREYSFGDGYEGSAIELVYIANPSATEATDIQGHWMGLNGAIKGTPSGPRNCLEDAIVAQLPENEKKRLNIYTGQDLRDQRIAHLLAHPHHAQQAAQHYQTLLYHDPGALMKGGGVWANTTTKLQGMEAWLDAHPALLSLLQKTGSILGGAMWLKNLTPAGLVSYLVTNYGYDKVLKLLDGSIEVGKEQLCAYFLAHDKDITPEQARYLSNVSMQVLLTGR